MAAFDGERYLRRLGERLLGDGGRGDDGRLSPLRGATAALVMVGVIGAEQGWRVIDDYRSAVNVRSGEPRFLHLPAPSRRGSAARLMPRQTMVIDQQIAVGQDRVLLRDLSLIADGGILRYRLYHDARSPREKARQYAPAGSPWRVRPPEIVDFDGNRLEVRRGDRGSDGTGYSDAEWELGGTLARDAAWLLVDGIEIGLSRRGAPSEVRVEALPAEDPVERYLWRALAVADARSGRTMDLEPLIQALLAAGVLREGSRLVRDLRAVAARMPTRPLFHVATRATPTGSSVAPWNSLLGRLGRRDGPEWTRVIDATAPVCDGVRVAVHWISSDLAGFEVEFEVTPHVLGAVALGELPVAWWGRDELQNHYLGVPTGWSLEGEVTQGTMRYWPALDPRATRLDLVMGVDTHQAIISVHVGSEQDG